MMTTRFKISIDIITKLVHIFNLNLFFVMSIFHINRNLLIFIIYKFKRKYIMAKNKVFFINKKVLIFSAIVIGIFLIFNIHMVILHINTQSDSLTKNPKKLIIVIDPGHGGIDGGAYQGGILEKDVNLDISLRLRKVLEQAGYKVIMTRESDVSLDSLNDSSGSRHQRDLRARTDIINNSGGNLFVSIHTNCNINKPLTDGSIVFYRSTLEQNKILALYLQKSLNNIFVNEKRTIHQPAEGRYYILGYSKIPGVIVETAFLSNQEDRALILSKSFRENIAKAIAKGIDAYLKAIK